MTPTFVLAFLSAVPVLAAPGWIDQVYRPSDEFVPNPERGLYMELADRRQRRLKPDRLRRLTDDGITLVQRLYYLKQYRDRPLDERQLALIRADFDEVQRAGMKAIIRFAYSSRIGEPDAPLPVVLGHIEQLRSLLRANSDLILTVQAGFIGAWGEWHSSTNGLTTPKAMRNVAAALLEALPPDRTIQVRTPRYKMRITESEEPLSLSTIDRRSSVSRIGHHNDCFLADDTDVGTYRSDRVALDRAYLSADSLFVPVGGETCRDGPRTDAKIARAEMEQMHWSFLNQAYHQQVIGTWRDNGFLEEVRRRLGYRLSLVRFRSAESVSPSGHLMGEITIKNDGFAAPIYNRPVHLLLVDSRGEVKQRSALDVDVRELYPGIEHVWPFRMPIPPDTPAGRYALRIWLPDPSPRLKDDARYAIQLANAELATAPDGSNSLGVEVIVVSQGESATTR